MEATATLDLEHICFGLVAVALQAEMVPVEWCLGRDARAEVFRAMTQHPLSSNGSIVMALHGDLPPYMGIPCRAMKADGVALRTVAKQIESGFD